MQRHLHWRGDLQGDGSFALQVADLVHAGGLFHASQVEDRNDLALRCGQRSAVELLRRQNVVLGGFDHQVDLLFPLGLEIADHGTVHQDIQGHTEVPGTESVGFETIAVRHETNFRIGQLDGRNRTNLGTGDALSELAEDRSCCRDDLIEIITADIHFNTATTAEAALEDAGLQADAIHAGNRIDHTVEQRQQFAGPVPLFGNGADDHETFPADVEHVFYGGQTVFLLTDMRSCLVEKGLTDFHAFPNGEPGRWHQNT